MLDIKQNFTRAKDKEAKTLSRSVREVKCRKSPKMNLPGFVTSQEPELFLG